MPFIYLAFGMGFGYLLTRAGATEYDFYAKLFLFEDLQLLWVIVSAVTIGIIGIQVLKRSGTQSLAGRETLEFKGRPFRHGLVIGSLLFGLGWGLAGACPGSVLAMLGEGKLAALPTIAGIVLGTWLYTFLPENWCPECRNDERAGTGQLVEK